MANEGYHEPIDELSDEARDMHCAIVSLMEKREAVDGYNQRADACLTAARQRPLRGGSFQWLTRSSPLTIGQA